ncbi:MAG: RsmB/NOP family class I SAM-dependent RNA methyltransferase [Thermodesulfobacteriota bacterium]
MNLSFLLPHAVRLLADLLAAAAPADKVMEAYFRDHRGLGVRDRGFVAETVYGALRHLRLLRHVAGDAAPSAELVAVELLRQGISGRAVAEARCAQLPEARVRELAGRLRSLAVAELPAGVRADLPDWLLERLVAQFGEEEAMALAAGLNEPAPLDIRVNLLKCGREELRQRLAAEGFAAEPTPWSPWGLRRRSRAPLFSTASFKEGLFEVQDEGSQLISLLVEAKRREMVADFCAGAGGKTLAMGAMMANRGTLYAFDTSDRRLARIRPRLARAGLDNVRVVRIAHERDQAVRRLAGKMHRVLVDAPCSGTGTLRRSPDIKWRPIDLARLAEEQGRILAAAATLVRPGGRMVYATCSLLHEENEAVVEAFLAADPRFRLVSAADILARRDVRLPQAAEMLRLLPHRHGCDGFFAAVLEASR